MGNTKLLGFVLVTLHIFGMMSVEGALYLEINLEDYRNTENKVVRDGEIRCCEPSELPGHCITPCSPNITIFVSIPRFFTFVIKHVGKLPALPIINFKQQVSNPLYLIFDESQNSLNVTVRIDNANNTNQLILERSFTTNIGKNHVHILDSKITLARLVLTTSTKHCSTRPRGQCLEDGTFQCLKGWYGQQCSVCDILSQRHCYPGSCIPVGDSLNSTCHCPASYVLIGQRCVNRSHKTSVHSSLALRTSTISASTGPSTTPQSIETPSPQTTVASPESSLATSYTKYISTFRASTPYSTSEISSSSSTTRSATKDSEYERSTVVPKLDTTSPSSSVGTASEYPISLSSNYASSSEHSVKYHTLVRVIDKTTQNPFSIQTFPVSSEHDKESTATMLKGTSSLPTSEYHTSISTRFSSQFSSIGNTMAPTSKASSDLVTTSSNIATSISTSDTTSNTRASYSTANIPSLYVYTKSLITTEITPPATTSEKDKISVRTEADLTPTKRVTRGVYDTSFSQETTEGSTTGTSSQTSLILNFTGPTDLGKVRESLIVLASTICPGTKTKSLLLQTHQINARAISVALTCNGKAITRVKLKDQIESLSKEKLEIMFPNINSMNKKDSSISTKTQVTEMTWLSSNWQLVLGISIGVSFVLIITVLVMVCKRRKKIPAKTHGRYVDNSVQDEEEIGMAYLSPVYSIYNPSDEDA